MLLVHAGLFGTCLGFWSLQAVLWLTLSVFMMLELAGFVLW